jgi:hypothetical protein
MQGCITKGMQIPQICITKGMQIGPKICIPKVMTYLDIHLTMQPQTLLESAETPPPPTLCLQPDALLGLGDDPTRRPS